MIRRGHDGRDVRTIRGPPGSRTSHILFSDGTDMSFDDSRSEVFNFAQIC